MNLQACLPVNTQGRTPVARALIRLRTGPKTSAGHARDEVPQRTSEVLIPCSRKPSTLKTPKTQVESGVIPQTSATQQRGQ